MKPDQHPYSSDRPISSCEEDILGRSAFATRLAKDIQSWRGRDSLVVGIYGEWGEGKTSLKNLILDIYSMDTNKSPRVVEFNPWQLSGTGFISAALFNELEVVFTENVDIANQAESTRKFHAYSTLCSLAGTTASYVGDAFALLGQDSAAVAAKTIAATSKAAGKAFQEGSEAASAANTPKPKSISALKKELVELFGKSEDPILFVIDDIDRLTTNEILEVFQFVKANADFPRLVYLLLFDRQVVSDALNVVSSGKGSAYLEKIVQVPHHIPKASRFAIDQQLSQGLDRYLESAGASKSWDQDRWNRIQRHVLNFFETIRDVKRFLASFGFHLGHHTDGSVLDVNPVDLLVLEVLRVFEPAVYERIASEKWVLTEWNLYSPEKRIDSVLFDKTIAEIHSLVQYSLASNVGTLVEELFPQPQRQPTWHKELRVCHKETFDRYFTLTMPDSEVRQSTVNAMIRESGSSQRFSSTCESLIQEEKIESALQYLDMRYDEIPIENMPAVSLALCNIGDHFPHTRRFIRHDAATSAWRILYFGLLRLPPQRRFEILIKVIQQTSGIVLPVQLVSLDERRGDSESQGNDFLVEAEDWNRLRDACLPIIRKRSKTKAFRESSWLMSWLYRWGQWATFDEVREWLKPHIKTGKGAVWFLSQFVTEVTSLGGTQLLHYEFDQNEMKRFLNPMEFRASLRRAKRATLSEREAAVLLAFEGTQVADKGM